MFATRIIMLSIILLIDLSIVFILLNNKIRTILILILVSMIMTKVFRNRKIMISNMIIHFSIINRDWRSTLLFINLIKTKFIKINQISSIIVSNRHRLKSFNNSKKVNRSSFFSNIDQLSLFNWLFQFVQSKTRQVLNLNRYNNNSNIVLLSTIISLIRTSIIKTKISIVNFSINDRIFQFN